MTTSDRVDHPSGDWDPFAGLSAEQLDRLEVYERLLSQANRTFNLISKGSARDIRNRHIAHSLMIGIRGFPPGARVVDWGTGGGLPGIPLAIRFPDATFHLVDSIYKKARKVEMFCKDLALSNVTVHCMRAEEWSDPVDYAVSRATAPLADLWKWTEPFLQGEVSVGEGVWRPGLIALKGGDLSDEISDLHALDPDTEVEEIDVSQMTAISGMAGKYLIHVEKSRVERPGPA